ncbi:hypothetical protein MKW98_013211, partial [Papaver atlanticum]
VLELENHHMDIMLRLLFGGNACEVPQSMGGSELKFLENGSCYCFDGLLLEH